MNFVQVQVSTFKFYFTAMSNHKCDGQFFALPNTLRESWAVSQFEKYLNVFKVGTNNLFTEAGFRKLTF